MAREQNRAPVAAAPPACLSSVPPIESTSASDHSAFPACLLAPAQALKNEPLTMFGDGKQTRSFQYVSDLIEGECCFTVFYSVGLQGCLFQYVSNLIEGEQADCAVDSLRTPASGVCGVRFASSRCRSLRAGGT